MEQNKKVGIVTHPMFLEHIKDSGHIESPNRLKYVYEMLEESEIKDLITYIEPRMATKEEISWNHDINYINRIEKTKDKDFVPLDPDTITNEKTWEAACLSVGGGFALIDKIFDGTVENGFLLCRPPGHHAIYARAMGFCIFNNVALGAHYLKRQYNLTRIAIIDWDLHHGNATQDAFYGDREVLFISTHQYPHYPGSGSADQIGKGDGEYFTLNIPLSAGMGDFDYATIFNVIIKPVIREFNPQFILVSAGFDIYFNDPLGGMRVTPKGFAYLSMVLLELAKECCNGRIAFYLEGGYNYEGLTQGIKAVILECAGKTILTDKEINEFSNKKDKNLPIIKRVMEIHSKKWNFS